jgi:hypothetical protein
MPAISNGFCLFHDPAQKARRSAMAKRGAQTRMTNGHGVKKSDDAGTRLVAALSEIVRHMLRAEIKSALLGKD